MNVEDINSHKPVAERLSSSCTSIFHLACVTTMEYILGNHNNIKSFGTKYHVEPENGENLIVPIFVIRCTDDVSIMLGDYGSKFSTAIVYSDKVLIGITYQFTHPIAQETEIKDLCEELYRLIMVLLHYDKIKLFEYRHMRGHYEFTEQDLKDAMNIYDLDSKPAEVIELR